MLTLDDVLILAPGVVSQESDGELVVVVPERGKYVVLNGTGAEVFQLLTGQSTLDEIAVALSQRYDIPQTQTQADVLALAEKLLDRGAVMRSSSVPASEVDGR